MSAPGFGDEAGLALFAHFSPIRQWLASRDHSGTGIGNRRNGTDHLPLRAPADGSTACWKRDLQGRHARECFENCVEIGSLSNSRRRETASLVFRMTVVATGVSRPILQKDRFDPRFEGLETKGMRRRRRRLYSGGVRRTVENPGSEYLPIRILLRLPEFTAGVLRVAARLLCQRVKQETAAERITGSHQLGHDFKILARLCFRPRRIPRQEGLESKARR